MVRTRVGYAGGSRENPSYRDLGDHSEAVQMDFDPSKVSFAELLGVFWDSHDPWRRPWSRQYMAAVFCHDEGQRRAAEETRDRLAREGGRPVETPILPYAGFYLAEDYHQKHALQRYPELMEELAAHYPDMRGITASTAAARINGFVAGYGGCERLGKEIRGFGLSDRGLRILAGIVCGA